ncbi:MAG: dTMP kinase [bacterium]|nr:dTMP kinase [bacterium]
MAGYFISFEGIDKSGKSTQARHLTDHLRSRGYGVVDTHEPGGTDLGLQIRHLLLTWKPDGRVDARAELLLFAADRAQHVAEVIRPALAQNKVVITDRYVDSTMAYQGFGRGLDLADLQRIQDIATGGLMPDLTVLVEVDVATARARYGKGRADRLESEDNALFQKVMAGYTHLCDRSPDRFLKVDGSGAIGPISKQILAVVESRLTSEHLAAAVV